MWVITIQDPLTTGAGLLGNILSFLVTLAPVPTFYRIYKKKSTESFDSLPYVVALFSAMMWLYYALISVDVLLMTINTAACFIESTYLLVYLLYAPTKAKIFTLKLIFFLNVGVFGSFVSFVRLFVTGRKRTDITGWICASFAVAVFAAPLNIIRVVITTKSVKYMPFLLSFFLTLSAVSWFAYGILLGDLHIALPNVLGFIFGITQIAVYFIYMNEKVHEIKPQDTNLQVTEATMPPAATSNSAKPPEICECPLPAEP